MILKPINGPDDFDIGDVIKGNSDRPDTIGSFEWKVVEKRGRGIVTVHRYTASLDPDWSTARHYWPDWRIFSKYSVYTELVELQYDPNQQGDTDDDI